MFFSLHSMTCNISSLGGFMSRGDFVLPKLGWVFVLGVFCPGGFCPGGFCPGGLLSCSHSTEPPWWSSGFQIQIQPDAFKYLNRQPNRALRTESNIVGSLYIIMCIHLIKLTNHNESWNTVF